MIPSDSAIPLDKPKTCLHCGKSLKGKRSDAKYCDTYCKQYAYLERNGIGTRKPPQESVCQYKKCGGPIVGKQANARYCCPNHQKMDWHNRKEARIKALIELLEGKGKKK